ncbi:hypothetical protein ACQ4PT_009211 [Festuca glaucescens]
MLHAGTSRDKFSVAFHHGGYFVGTGSNRAYVGGAVIWFDHCDVVEWTVNIMEDCVEEMGYEMSGRIRAYYLLPILTLQRNGLRGIFTDTDTEHMLLFVSLGHLFLNIYLDHDESLRRMEWDDVVQFPVTDLPPVLSPVKQNWNRSAIDEQEGAFEEQLDAFEEQHDVVDEQPEPIMVVPPEAVPDVTARRKSTRVLAMEEANEENSEEEDGGNDSDYNESVIVDSENDMSEGDVDLGDEDDSQPSNQPMKGMQYPSLQMEQPVKGKQAAEDQCGSDEELFEDDDLWGPDSDDDNLKLRFKTFRAEDMKNPSFHTGQVFDNVEVLRKAIREYSCQSVRDLKFKVNDSDRVCVKCKGNCPWYIWASKDNRTEQFQVKRYTAKHTCSKVWQLNAFTSNFLAEKYVEQFRADEGMSMKNFTRIIQKEWNMKPSRSKLWRARRLAMTEIYGDEIGQYKMLWDYANEVRTSNPGSTFYLALDEQSRFKKCYVRLDACKRGFLDGCRPVLFLDGCHIKTRYRGQLLTAVGIDPNDCIFPVAFAVVEVEDIEAWRWFLQTLKEDLGIENTYPWTVMSDKQKGLIKAVQELFPNSEHRFCVRHMWQNFQQSFRGDVLKNQLWKIARSSTVTKWEANMEEMKLINPEAHAWLEELPPNTWVRAFQSDLPKCDVLLNNISEVFNKYILEARELPKLSMLERIKHQLMIRHCTKLKEAQKMVGLVCPKIKKKVEKNMELASNIFADGAGEGIFAIDDGGSGIIIDLVHKSCTCRRWDLSGIPCPHACAALRGEDIDPLTVVDNCYSVEMFKRAYGNIIMPCRDKTEWKKLNETVIHPPHYLKKVGRPTKRRRKAPYEVDHASGGRKLTRHGTIIHCGYCHEPDHNKKGCKYLKAGMPPPNVANNVEHPVQDEPPEEPVIT